MSHDKRLKKLLSVVSLSLFVFYVGLTVKVAYLDWNLNRDNPSPIGIDFAAYYAATGFVIGGQPELSYDISVHHEVLEDVLQRKVPFELPWAYPPTFLTILAPFALLNFSTALILWLVGTFLLAFFALYKMLPENKWLSVLIFGFPGVLMNLKWGQNGFLNVALLGLGLHFMKLRPALSGFMFGMLSYKPQILLFPILVLLATKNWWVLIYTFIWGALFAGGSLMLFGWETWEVFFRSFLGTSANLMTDVWEYTSTIQPTMYTVLRTIGLQGLWLYVILGLVMAMVLICVVWVWHNTEKASLKGSAMVVGGFIAVPYFVQYDLMVLAVPLVLLAFDFISNGCKAYERVLLYILWMMPMVNWPIAEFTGIQIAPFVLILTLSMMIYRVKTDNRKGDLE